MALAAPTSPDPAPRGTTGTPCREASRSTADTSSVLRGSATAAGSPASASIAWSRAYAAVTSGSVSTPSGPRASWSSRTHVVVRAVTSSRYVPRVTRTPPLTARGQLDPVPFLPMAIEAAPAFLDTQHLLNTFGLIGLMLIIFAETGLLVGFFLPGDSLLFTAGLVAAGGLAGGSPAPVGGRARRPARGSGAGHKGG